jgi:hypothetical protein
VAAPRLPYPLGVEIPEGGAQDDQQPILQVLTNEMVVQDLTSLQDSGVELLILDDIAKPRRELRPLAGRPCPSPDVRLDVDVLDFVDCPIADVPQYAHGMTLAAAMASLRVLVASPRFGGLVVTEINPNHAARKESLSGGS